MSCSKTENKFIPTPGPQGVAGNAGQTGPQGFTGPTGLQGGPYVAISPTAPIDGN